MHFYFYGDHYYLAALSRFSPLSWWMPKILRCFVPSTDSTATYCCMQQQLSEFFSTDFVVVVVESQYRNRQYLRVHVSMLSEEEPKNHKKFQPK